jgi:ABC-type nitrate/sulfonate/bicarbonate transport system substrate-binding protein
VCAALLAPAAPGRSADLPTINVGLICGGMTPMIAQVALNDGSFEKAGVHVVKDCFTGGPQAVQALVGKSIDAFIGSYDHVLRQRARSIDVKVYAELYNGYSYQLIGKLAAPASLAQAKGLTLGVTAPGALSDDALRLGLTEAGLNPDRDVTIVATGSGAPMVAALDTDRIAAGMLAEPSTTALTDSGKYKVVFDPTQPFAGNVIMAQTAFVAANKPAFTTMLAVLRATAVRVAANPQVAVEPMRKDFPTISPGVMLVAIKHTLPHVPKGLLVDRKSTDPVVAATLKKGDITTAIPFEAAVDNSILDSIK